MKVRARWFAVAGDVRIQLLADGMQGRQYSRRRPSGFRIEDVRREYVVGTFIERVEWDDTLEDPAGGALNVHRVELRRFRFRLSSTPPELEVFDAPRSLRAFVDHVSACAGDLVKLVELALPPAEWLDEVEKRTGRTTVTAVTAAGLTLSPSASASVSVVGTEDVRKFLGRFTKGREVGIERIVATLPSPHGGRVELLGGGRVGILDGGERTVDLLRDALRTCVEGQSAKDARAPGRLRS